ncbi:ATP-binding cassette domain-containing protein [Nocardioides sp.]|uniref:ABC transporter ATP-binding protein n=1 Tax=Nocardioides sp. TaxID=35761 RepID=UPI0019AB3508|nr:ATP-binding cassette domain-containing protein [Nocardioides sp.]MBC7276002.1 ATP-binding cassette domain-containing protein [Nocardioides sp.]
MIQIDALSKRYGGFTAVDNVTFNAEPGRVTGFLGPNGAGKSTTMRILVGLTDPSSGSAHLLGRHFSQLPNPGLEVGVLLDASAQHGGRTGREILTLAARTMGLPKTRVAETLERVSLTEEEAGRRVRNYSLGMRQRLGIATALIGDPEVLILDEPANGLDPAGIRWMRDLLRGFADDGGTVLLSSHLLHEIEVIADDIVVIGNGRIVAQGTKQELLAGGGTYARTSDLTALGRALQRAGHTAEITSEGAVLSNAELAAVGQIAFDAGLALTELRAADGAGLEEMFLQLTASTQRDHLESPEGLDSSKGKAA